METPPDTEIHLADTIKRIAWRLMAIVHNRTDLLMVEIQEERERARAMVILAAGAAFLGLLGAITLTAVIAIAAGPHYFLALIIMTACYLGGALIFYLKLSHLQRDWELLSGTREQLEKDRACLEKELS